MIKLFKNKKNKKMSKFKVGDEWSFATNDPQLCQLIKQNGGKMQLGQYNYSLSGDEKYLKRTPISRQDDF